MKTQLSIVHTLSLVATTLLAVSSVLAVSSAMGAAPTLPGLDRDEDVEDVGEDRDNEVSRSTAVVYYALKMRHSNRCVDVMGSTSSTGAPLVQYGCNSASDSQKFEFVYTGTGSYYQLRAKHSLKCVDVAENSVSNNVVLDQAACNVNDRSQWFSLAYLSNGYYQLQSYYNLDYGTTKRCLNIPWGLTGDAIPTQLFGCTTNSTNDQFSLIVY